MVARRGELEPFCRLDKRWAYVACQWDLATNESARRYFVDFFKGQYERTLMLARSQAESAKWPTEVTEGKIVQCREQFTRHLDELAACPGKFGRPTVITIDRVRDGLLREAGFHDPYYELKHHDNELVMALLPEVCRDLDEHREPFRLQAAIQGALAGNIFDMGVAVTAKRIMERSLSFLHTRDNMPRRPWIVDDFDALERRMLTGPVHRKAVMFVDNAGADFVLGMLPLARYLAQRGTQVVIVANELATLNDMTVKDVKDLWAELIAAEPSLEHLPIRVVSSGTGEPLIDLSGVSLELNEAAKDADLVILEGMGRALESNLFARFDCDVLKIAMIKDEFVAQSLGGKLYDVVCRFEPAC